MISEEVPSINCGMRGLSYVEVKVTGPNKDLHSGHYGGAIAGCTPEKKKYYRALMKETDPFGSASSSCLSFVTAYSTVLLESGVLNAGSTTMLIWAGSEMRLPTMFVR